MNMCLIKVGKRVSLFLLLINKYVLSINYVVGIVLGIMDIVVDIRDNF